MVLPRTLIILLELAAAVVVIGGIRTASWLVGPVFLALVIVITVHPVHARLRRRGLPGWAATTLLVLVVYGVLVVLAGVVVVSLARLATLLPSYAPQFNDAARLGHRRAGRGSASAPRSCARSRAR